jgi:hypothetical protein
MLYFPYMCLRLFLTRLSFVPSDHLLPLISTSPVARICLRKHALIISGKEGRSISQSCPRIRPRNRLSRITAVCENEAVYADGSHQALCVSLPEALFRAITYISYNPQLPTPSFSRIHPLSRNLPSRHQAPESSPQSSNRSSKAV